MPNSTEDAPRYAAVPPLGSDPSQLRDAISAWVDSAALNDLAAAEGAHPTGTAAERLAYLDDFSATHWDFRGGAERNQVARESVTGDREQLVIEVARALGLIEPRPPRWTAYDHVFILGGLVRANVWRTAYAAHLVAHVVDASSVTALTAYRHLAANPSDPTQDEHALLDAFSLPQREFEAEVVEDAFRATFAAEPFTAVREGALSDNAFDRFRVARTTAGGLTLTVVAAPDPKSQQRADTATTMRYWASEVAQVQPGDRLLYVTSAIYVPFQHANALQTLALPYGATVDTVAIDHGIIDPTPFPQVFRGVNYLQEIRSTIRAYRSLLTALDQQPVS